MVIRATMISNLRSGSIRPAGFFDLLLLCFLWAVGVIVMCVHSTNPSLFGAKIPASYQEDRSPQKILCPGRMPGSESREPAGINNFLPLLLRNGRPDPHSEQKTLVNRRSPG